MQLVRQALATTSLDIDPGAPLIILDEEWAAMILSSLLAPS